VNWLQEDPGQDNESIGFDLVVYAPNFISSSVHYGFNILVGEDPTNVYIGGFGDVVFRPNRFDTTAAAHTISGTDYSYQSRIKALLDNLLDDIGTDGSAAGTICKDAITLCWWLAAMTYAALAECVLM
jgi:hypothetical protein